MAEADTAMDAVRWALSAYLPPDQASRAAALWQRPTGDTPASAMTGLSRYCRLVAQHFDLGGREAELHLRIIRALKAQAQAQPQGPGDAQADALPDVSSTSHLKRITELPAGSALLMQRFLEATEQHLRNELGAAHSAQRWRQALVGHVKRVPVGSMHQLSDWLWGRTAGLQGPWPARGLGTQLINAAYVALAESLGPVRADACFTSIVREFEQASDPSLSGIRSYL
jgi:hypothetical protein